MCITCYSRSPERRLAGKKYLERDRARSKKYREQDLAAQKARYAADPQYRESMKARSRDWYASNKERQAASSRAWTEANPDKVRSALAARRARQRGLFVERVYRSVVWRRDTGVCHLCLQPADPADWDLDHVISLDSGGPHAYANTAVSHPSCNRSKQASSRSLCGVRWAEATGAYEKFHGRKYV